MEILHSQILGEGKPLLILHGYLGMGDNWRTIGGRLAERGYKVHILDMRNHGKSFHSDDFSYEIMSRDVLNYMDDKGIERASIIGHSMGGKTAMLFACKYPEKVDKLVVVDISVRVYPAHHNLILSSLDSVNFSKVKNRAEVDDILGKNILDVSVRQFLLKNVYWETPEKLNFRFNLPVLHKEYAKILAALPSDLEYFGDTLFVKGEKSKYIEEVDKEMIKKQFPNSEIVVVEKAGHWVHADNPDGFFKAIEKIL